VLALVNSHAAAALQYGIERDFVGKAEWVLLYDMGAASTEASLVKYSSFVVKEAGKPKTYRRVLPVGFF
jgi:hypoxia up-regulated 1